MRKALPIIFMVCLMTGTLYGQWIEQSHSPGESIWASSSLTETIGGRLYNYGPEALFDSDLSTSWVEGSEGNGVGESVTVLTNRPVNGLSLVNGFAESSKLFEQNGRVRDLKLTFIIGFTAPGLVTEMDYSLYFLQEFEAGIHTLKDHYDWQSITLSLESNGQFEIFKDVLNDFARDHSSLYGMMLDEAGLSEGELISYENLMLLVELYGFMAVRLEINSIYSGSRYQDCCLSELRFNLGEF